MTKSEVLWRIVPVDATKRLLVRRAFKRHLSHPALEQNFPAYGNHAFSKPAENPEPKRD